MCNLSEGIEEKALEKGRTEGREEEKAEKAEKAVEAVKL